jgi:hypothetical protein
LTGILGTYKANDMISVSAGVADTANGIDTRALRETQKAYLGLVTLTAPDSWGWMKGATLNAGVIQADNGSAINGQAGRTQLYVGAVVPTPLDALKAGASFDYVDLHNGVSGASSSNPQDDSTYDVAIYGNYKYNDKLSFNLRGEYLNDGGQLIYPFVGSGHCWRHRSSEPNSAEEVTATVRYALWANVLSQFEFRWDHVEHGTPFGANATTGDPNHENAFLLAANLIYQF